MPPKTKASVKKTLDVRPRFRADGLACGLYTFGGGLPGADGRIVYDADGWAICNAVTFHGKHREGQDRAHARLIATAPEMAKALAEVFADHGKVNSLEWMDRVAGLLARAQLKGEV